MGSSIGCSETILKKMMDEPSLPLFSEILEIVVAAGLKAAVGAADATLAAFGALDQAALEVDLKRFVLGIADRKAHTPKKFREELKKPLEKWVALVKSLHDEAMLGVVDEPRNSEIATYLNLKLGVGPRKGFRVTRGCKNSSTEPKLPTHHELYRYCLGYLNQCLQNWSLDIDKDKGQSAKLYHSLIAPLRNVCESLDETEGTRNADLGVLSDLRKNVFSIGDLRVCHTLSTHNSSPDEELPINNNEEKLPINNEDHDLFANINESPAKTGDGPDFASLLDAFVSDKSLEGKELPLTCLSIARELSQQLRSVEETWAAETDKTMPDDNDSNRRLQKEKLEEVRKFCDSRLTTELAQFRLKIQEQQDIRSATNAKAREEEDEYNRRLKLINNRRLKAVHDRAVAEADSKFSDPATSQADVEANCARVVAECEKQEAELKRNDPGPAIRKEAKSIANTLREMYVKEYLMVRDSGCQEIKETQCAQMRALNESIKQLISSRQAEEASDSVEAQTETAAIQMAAERVEGQTEPVEERHISISKFPIDARKSVIRFFSRAFHEVLSVGRRIGNRHIWGVGRILEWATKSKTKVKNEESFKKCGPYFAGETNSA